MEDNTVSIKLFEVIGGVDAISTMDGDTVFGRIDRAFAAGMSVVLDFQNIDLVITAFLNAAIGQLYGKYEEQFIQSHISVINMRPEDQNQVRIVTRRAKEYFKNKAKMDDIISSTLENDPES